MKTLVSRHFLERVRARNVDARDLERAAKELERIAARGGSKGVISASTKTENGMYMFRHGECRIVFTIQDDRDGEKLVVLMTVF
jgi:mRNA-degrading endonuclease RelE of RelBE toxin-antitoxin system